LHEMPGRSEAERGNDDQRDEGSLLR